MGSHRICEFLSLGRGVVPTVFWGKRNCQGPEGGFLRNTSTALILNRFSPRLIRLRRRLVRTRFPTPTRTKIGARMNLSHLRRVRNERRKIKGRGVPLDSSLLMDDPADGQAILHSATMRDVRKRKGRLAATSRKAPAFIIATYQNSTLKPREAMTPPRMSGARPRNRKLPA